MRLGLTASCPARHRRGYGASQRAVVKLAELALESRKAFWKAADGATIGLRCQRCVDVLQDCIRFRAKADCFIGGAARIHVVETPEAGAGGPTLLTPVKLLGVRFGRAQWAKSLGQGEELEKRSQHP